MSAPLYSAINAVGRNLIRVCSRSSAGCASAYDTFSIRDPIDTYEAWLKSLALSDQQSTVVAYNGAPSSSNFQSDLVLYEHHMIVPVPAGTDALRSESLRRSART